VLQINGRLYQRLDVVLQQARRQLLAAQIAVDPVMTDALKVFSQVRDGVVNGAAQQVLAVVQLSEAHLLSLKRFYVSPD